ncbi:MAG: terminase family protein [Caldilineaceae bacterium]|nr:terminase family protein [Caldilineaceae bacterium]
MGKTKSNRDLTFRQFVNEVQPGYQWYRHCEILADVLQKVADGELKRLMVFMPPRHGKSELVSRLFTAYHLYRHPDKWVGVNSYAAELAYSMSRNARDNYQRAGGEISDDAWAVRHWETGKDGGMWAAGVGGPITGKGFHLGIIDDPLKNAEEAQSAIIREKHKDWYRSTFSTREEPDGAIVVVQTRWHNDDLSGWLLNEMEEDEPEHWHIVRFEAIKDDVEDGIPTSCTLEPDFRNSGEPLCDVRYPLEKLRKFQRRLGIVYWSALFQQRPSPEEGNIFKRQWWDTDLNKNRYDIDDSAIRNRVVARWLTFDTAFKDKAGNDFSACTCWELWPDYRIAVRWMWQERIDSAFLPSKIAEFARRWNVDGKLRAVVIEDKGSGTTSIQTLRMSAESWLAEMINEFVPTGTKEYRARLASVWCEKDCIQLPWSGPEWYPDFLDPETGQLWVFPNAAHDDLVDTFTMGILYLENFISEGWHARQGKAKHEPSTEG